VENQKTIPADCNLRPEIFPGCIKHAHQGDCEDCWRAALDEAQRRRSSEPSGNLMEDVGRSHTQ